MTYNSADLRSYIDVVKGMKTATICDSTTEVQVADRYEILRLGKDEVKGLTPKEIRALIDYITGYLEDSAGKYLYRKNAKYNFQDKASGRVMTAYPEVEIADFGEISTQLKMKEVLKILTSELGRK